MPLAARGPNDQAFAGCSLLRSLVGAFVGAAAAAGARSGGSSGRPPWRLWRPRRPPPASDLQQPVVQFDPFALLPDGAADPDGQSSSDDEKGAGEGEGDGAGGHRPQPTPAVGAAPVAGSTTPPGGSGSFTTCMSCLETFPAGPQRPLMAADGAGAGGAPGGAAPGLPRPDPGRAGTRGRSSGSSSGASSSSSSSGPFASGGGRSSSCGASNSTRNNSAKSSSSGGIGGGAAPAAAVHAPLPSCGHFFCSACTTQYVISALQERRYPIRCPMAAAVQPQGGGAARPPQQGQGQRGQPPLGCRLRFSRESVLAALEGHPKEQQVFELLEAEYAIRKLPRVYCPHPSCSSPLLLPDPRSGEEEAGERLPRDKPVNCPACRAAFCPHCRVAGWHKGFTCAQFQALPPEDRHPDIASLLRLGTSRAWRRCPQCRWLVERSGGCNHIRCRCGQQFCYACGKAYLSSKPSATNVHGTQGCGCPLWMR